MPHSPLANPTATRSVLDAFGLAQKKRFGQHFLIDDGVVGRTLDLASLGPRDVVLEIGPGIGTLTIALCQSAGRVVAVERDERLLPVLEQTTVGCTGLTIVHADAVRVAPEELETPDGPPTALVANLPYEVAATVVLRAFEEFPQIESATVMVQAEVADRMAAVPRTKDYGAYTVKLALRAALAGRFSVGRGAFMPPPRVDSAVIRLERTAAQATPEELDDASAAATAAFAQRRKTLRNSISSALGAEPAAVEESLRAARVSAKLRAEALEPPEYLEIGRELRKCGLLP